MDLEEGIEIHAEREERQCQRHPQEARLAKLQQEERQRYIQRREKKESVVTDAISEPQQIALDGFRPAGAKRRLHLVLELLLARDIQMRLRVRLPGKRRGNAVLIAA